MVDGILDLVLMILVLAIVVYIGFSLILPMTNPDLMAFNENLNDKSSLRDVRDGEVIYDATSNRVEPERPTLTSLDVILLTQIQDENMPTPRSYKVESNAPIEVESTYKLVVRDTGMQIFDEIVALPSGLAAEYYVDYDYVSESYQILQK